MVAERDLPDQKTTGLNAIRKLVESGDRVGLASAVTSVADDLEDTAGHHKTTAVSVQ